MKIDKYTETIIEHSVSALAVRKPNQDKEWLIGHGFLNRAQAVMVSASPGVGKSSFSLHWAARLVLGLPFVGFQTAAPVRVLYLQNEDTEDDLSCEVRGIIEQTRPTAEQLQHLEENLVIRTALGLSGETFLEQLATELEDTRPQILVLDPLFAFIGVDATNQVMVTKFLRDEMAPLLRKYDCGWICIHHNKKERAGEGPKAYGSVEISAFFRGIVELSETKNGAVKLEVVKRTRQAGLKDAKGDPTGTIFLNKGESAVTWHLSAEKVNRVVVGLAADEPASKPIGRPPAATREEIDAFVKPLRDARRTDAQIVREIARVFDMTARNARRLLPKAPTAMPGSDATAQKTTTEGSPVTGPSG